MKQRLFTRDFTLLALGQAFSLAGNYALRFALSMYVLELTGSAGVFAGMLALAMAPTVLLSPLGGALADRCDRRRLMAGMDAASALRCCWRCPFSGPRAACSRQGRCSLLSLCWGLSSRPWCRPACRSCSRGSGCCVATRW